MKTNKVKVKRNNGDIFQDGFTTAILLGRSGGWATVQTKDGNQYKYRSGQVVEVPFDTPDEILDILSVPDNLRKYIPKASPPKPEPVRAAATHIKIGRMMVPKDRYHVNRDVKTSSGRSSVDNGDPVASALRGLPLPAVYRMVADAIEVPLPELEARYRHLNPGMQRMNLGNIYRKAVRK